MQPIFLIEDTRATFNHPCKYYAFQEGLPFWSDWQLTEKLAIKNYLDQPAANLCITDVVQSNFLVKKVLYNNKWYTGKQFKTEYPEFFL